MVEKFESTPPEDLAVLNKLVEETGAPLSIEYALGESSVQHEEFDGYELDPHLVAPIDRELEEILVSRTQEVADQEARLDAARKQLVKAADALYADIEKDESTVPSPPASLKTPLF